MICRRSFLSVLAAPIFGGRLRAAGATGFVGFNTGTYGAKAMKTADALRAMAGIGYDGVELALMPGWPTDPAAMSEPDRRELRSVVNGTGLAVPSVMESLPLNGMEQNRAHNLERLKMAIDLGHAMAPDNPPVVETVLGGKSQQWDQTKGRIADELAAWAKLAEQQQNTICFKPHADQAVDMPERAIWLLDQVKSPRIRIVYDYSHYQVQGLKLEDTLRKLIPYTAYIAVKDAAGNAEKHEYLLPGDGNIDYLAYFRLLKELNYSGFVGVEVSSMIHQKPGYSAVPTLRLCYDRLAPIFREAGLRRPPARKLTAG